MTYGFTEWYWAKKCVMSTMRSRMMGSPGRGLMTTGSFSSTSFVTHASPFLPLMFIASDPHTPSRHERRSDNVSSSVLMRTRASRSIRSEGPISMS